MELVLSYLFRIADPHIVQDCLLVLSNVSIHLLQEDEENLSRFLKDFKEMRGYESLKHHFYNANLLNSVAENTGETIIVRMTKTIGTISLAKPAEMQVFPHIFPINA